MRRSASVVVLVAAAIALAGCLSKPPAAPAQFADRQTDPVVLTGAATPTLANVPVGDIVAFRYTNGAWKQFPVQVDQRKTVELNTVYHQPANTTNPVNVLVYADPNTWVGAGSGVLGSDDEIAFMAADAGDAAPPGGADPANVVANTRVQLTVTDPLNGHAAWAYLFRRAGTKLVPGANLDYVSYAFKLKSGDYKTTYKLTAGPNPEASAVTTASYHRTFADRWQDDGLQIYGVDSPVDILDRHKELFAPGVCGRSEDTFDSGEGAFIANIDGPVRAIRSFIGANSGPYTERSHIFYAQREDVITDLRVHAIPSVMDFLDFSDAARGMTYSNSANPAGVPIDGHPDPLTAGAPAWEKVDGAPGALTTVWSQSASFATTTTNWYEDNDTNPTAQCTGDADALGASGSYLTSAIPNTDPHNGTAENLRATRTLFFEAPNRSAADAARHASQVSASLTVVAG
jgi:hypothetical protein